MAAIGEIEVVVRADATELEQAIDRLQRFAGSSSGSWLLSRAREVAEIERWGSSSREIVEWEARSWAQSARRRHELERERDVRADRLHDLFVIVVVAIALFPLVWVGVR